MAGTSINEESLTAAIDALRCCAAVESAYLLGSGAADRLRPDSDIDVAILPVQPAGIPFDERFALAGELTRILGRQVDLGVLSTSNVVYAKEAIVTGRLIFERDHRVTARFVMLALSMYASLQEARREVLRAYAA